MLFTSFNETNITLIPKAQNGNIYKENYGPESLINIDAKTIHKILENCMQQYVERLYGPTFSLVTSTCKKGELEMKDVAEDPFINSTVCHVIIPSLVAQLVKNPPAMQETPV